MTKFFQLKIFICCLIFSNFFTFSFGQYHCDWNLFDAGGGFLSATNYQSAVSICQTAIGYLTGGNFNSLIGFWQFEPLSSIKEEEMPNPNILITKLYSPQPNPFIYKTKIFFSLRNNTFTKLLIYDLTGRVIKTLVNKNLKSGIYHLNWDGKDNSGKKVSSGIYLLKFQTENYQEIRKLLLIK